MGVLGGAIVVERSTHRYPRNRSNDLLSPPSILVGERFFVNANVRLNVGDPLDHIRKLGGKIPDARPSMLLDYSAGRRCEVDAINGAIPGLGKPLGVATPVNETVVGIIRARERRMLA